jgi:hypothetical protein
VAYLIVGIGLFLVGGQLGIASIFWRIAFALFGMAFVAGIADWIRSHREQFKLLREAANADPRADSKSLCRVLESGYPDRFDVTRALRAGAGTLGVQTPRPFSQAPD